MSDLDYFKTARDYEEIKEFLELDPEGFEIPMDIPDFQPDFSKAIVVDNVPIVTQEKLGKLTQVILKIYRQVLTTLKEEDIYMPFNEDGSSTCGFCFITFETTEQAQHAVTATQGFAMSKTNIFKVSLYSDLEKYANYPDEFQSPAPMPFTPRPDIMTWMSDSQCRDQFVIRHGPETGIYWGNQTGEDPSLIYDGAREKVGGKVWCESFVTWSPQGTYLSTYHAAGIKLWGGEQFEAQCRFMHRGVEVVDFSHCENYMVTYRYDQSNAQHCVDAPIIIWDIRNSANLKSLPLKNPLDPKFQVMVTMTEDKAGKVTQKVFRGRVVSYNDENGTFTISEGSATHENVLYECVKPIQDPNKLKWSHDGQFIARLGCDIISVYELPSMNLLEKKSIAAKDISDFVWSPRSNMISYWAPAQGNHPSLISIIGIPDRAEISSRKIFDVQDGRMVWQNDGDYLCVHMSKGPPKKRTYVLMFFRVRDAGVPVEQVELPDAIITVAWEPSGDRICVVHGEPRNPTISFYSMSGASKTAKGKKELTFLFDVRMEQCSDILWSPAGNTIALVYYDTGASPSALFQLYDVDANAPLCIPRRHDRSTRLTWDPSGRYLASCTVTPLKDRKVRGNPEDGFIIYTFQGNVLSQTRRESLYQFQWRPRPRDVLTAADKKRVIKDLKKYERLFDQEDRRKRQELNQELLASRRRIAEEFYAILNRNKAVVQALKPMTVMIRGGYDEDDERNYVIETRTEEIVEDAVTAVIQ